MAKNVIQSTVLSANGGVKVAPGARIEVRNPAGLLVPLWLDREGAQPANNPLYADSAGFFRVYADAGRYHITASQGGQVQEWRDIELGSMELVASLATRTDALEAGQSAGVIGYATRDELEADLDHDEGTIAYVTHDPVPENNTTYRKLGESGDGSWERSDSSPVDLLRETVFGRLQPLRSAPEEGFSHALTDEFGHVVFGVSKEGVARFYDLDPDSLHELPVTKLSAQGASVVDTPAGSLVYGMCDEFGFLGFGWTEQGSVLLSGADLVGVPESSLAFAVCDEFGFLGFGVEKNGDVQMGGAELRSAAGSGFDYAVCDSFGFLGFGLTTQGGFISDQSGAAPEITDQVFRAFVEPWEDPSEDAAVTWFTQREGTQIVEYRLAGSTAWHAARSNRTRPFPEREEWIHTAVIKNLSPDAIYEFRVLNTTFEDRWKTSRNRAGIRLAWCADYQIYDFGPTQRLAKFGGVIRDFEIDLLLLGGDYINDDGDTSPLTSDRWAGFLTTLTETYRTKGGALIPMVAVMGNHEGGKEGTGTPADVGGDGIKGQTNVLFSCGYDPTQPTRYVDSAATIRVGKELLIVTLETDHTESLPDQLPWLAGVIEAEVPKYKHTLICGHAPAWNVAVPSRYTLTRQARTLRNNVWPMIQEHDDRIRMYLCGHDHALAVTKRLWSEYDDSMSLVDNDDRWTTTTGRGIRQVGTGPWGAGRRNLLNKDRVSSIDGESFIQAALGYDAGSQAPVQVGEGLVNPRPENRHVWFIDLSDDACTMRAVDDTGADFIQLEDAL